MILLRRGLWVAAFGILVMLGISDARSAPVPVLCTPIAFTWFGTPMTALMVNPPGVVNGNIDATGCTVAIYYTTGTGTIANANIFGSTYFGVLNNGANLNIQQSAIHDIGDGGGGQHGYAIYWASTASAGNIIDNQLLTYQKGGIDIDAGSATISGNLVQGRGPLTNLAQVGIAIGHGAKGSITNNVVTSHSYSGNGGTSAAGIELFGGQCFGSNVVKGTMVSRNTIIGNDSGVVIENLQGDCVNPPAFHTSNIVSQNFIRNNAVTNVTGDGPNAPFQFGVFDTGNADEIIDNRICGYGYTPQPPGPPFLALIGISNSVNTVVSGNKHCVDGTIIAATRR